MAIQVRRGNISDLDKGKLLPGEYACAMDKKRVFLQFGTTQETVLEMPTKENYEEMLKEVSDSAQQAQSAAEDARTATEKVQELLEHEEDVRKQIQEFSNEAQNSADEALQYKNDSEENVLIAAGYADSAAKSKEIAQTNADLTAQDLEEVQRLAQEAEESAASAETQASLSKSYAIGTGGVVRSNDDFDNARYYYEQAKHISQGGNGLVPMGTISFAYLPETDIVPNAMYNISDNFTSDERFLDGGGIFYGAGSNVYYTLEGKWDVLAASSVTGIKGRNEKEYRQGNVNLTCEDMGALPEDGDSKDNTVTFTSGDSGSAPAWTDVDVLTTGEKHTSMFSKISTMFKNVRYLYRLLGSTDISGIGNGTVTGAVNLLNADLANIKGEYLQNTDIFEWASSKKITSTCFAETNCLNTPGAGQGYAISLFVSGGGIKNMYAVSGSTREVYVSIFNTVAWTAWKQVSYTTPQLFYMTLNGTYCESSYSNCYRLGNIAILSLYLNVRNISGYDKLLLATLPFNVINASIQNCLLTGGEKGILYLENDGSLKFHANGANVTQSAILTQMLAVIDE